MLLHAGLRARAGTRGGLRARSNRERQPTRNVSERSCSKPGCTCCSRTKLRIINPAPTRSTSASATSAMTSALRSLSCTWPATATCSRAACGSGHGWRPGTPGSTRRGGPSGPRRPSHAQHGGVDADVGHPRQVRPGPGRAAVASAATANTSPPAPPPAASDHALGGQLPHQPQPPAPSAERSAISCCRRRPGEQQVRDVGAGDEQHEATAPSSANSVGSTCLTMSCLERHDADRACPTTRGSDARAAAAGEAVHLRLRLRER